MSKEMPSTAVNSPKRLVRLRTSTTADGMDARSCGLTGCGKIRFIHKLPLESPKWRRCHNSLRMLKKALQQGRSEVRDAKNNERHVCGRRRDGEPAVSWRRIVTFLPAHPEPAGTGSFPMGVR